MLNYMYLVSWGCMGTNLFLYKNFGWDKNFHFTKQNLEQKFFHPNFWLTNIFSGQNIFGSNFFCFLDSHFLTNILL